ncbi:MAG TPA: type II toxin-antitoxin system HicA family toxin [Bryobacteraceae bacterium]|nr:type II toxin-antitoxin system HicA family toxin [Bryobacteraceae bacterium]
MAAIRPISSQDLIRVLERDGFRFDRQEGDHRIYIKAGAKRPLVIPVYRAIPVFIIKNLLRTSGMSRDRYFELLGGL